MLETTEIIKEIVEESADNQSSDEAKMINLSDDLCYTKLSLCEESSKKKNKAVLCTVGGVFMELEKIGNNSRYYPEAVKDKIIGTPYTERCIKYKTLLGEPHHPDNERYSIWMDEASHNITELTYDPETKTIHGKADILDTPKGKALYTLIQYGSTLGISARSYGLTYKRGGVTYVDPESYVFKTFDFTTNPGFISARVSQMNEEEKSNFSSDLVSLMEECEDVSVLSIVKDYSQACGLLDVTAKADECLNTITCNHISAEEQLSSEINSLRSSLDSISSKASSYLDRVEHLKKELDNAYLKNYSLQDDILALSDKASTYASTLSAKDCLIDSLSERCNNLWDTISSKDSLITELQSKLDSYKTTDELISSKKSEIESLTKKYNDSLLAIDGYTSQISNLTETNKSLQDSLQSSSSEIESLNSIILEKEESISKLKSLLNKYREEVSNLKSHNDSLEKSHRELSEECSKLSKENHSLQEELSTLKESSDSVKEELTSLKEEFTSLKEKEEQYKILTEELTQEPLAEETSMPSLVSSSVEIGIVTPKEPNNPKSSLERMLGSVR